MATPQSIARLVTTTALLVASCGTATVVDVDSSTPVDASADLDSAMLAEDSEVGPVDAASDDAGLDAATAPDAGPIHGHAVIIGDLVTMPDDAFDTMFANAIFLSERPRSDLRVLEYDEHSASFGGSPHAEAVMDAAATSRGRTLTRTPLSSAAGLSAALPTTDVLFVPYQFADQTTMTTVAGFWHDPLLAFLRDGGVVVLLAGNAMVSGDSGEQWRLLDAADLFSLPMGGNYLGGGTATIEIVTADSVATGVASPFATRGTEASCFQGSARGVLVARTMDANLCPVVRHLVF